MPFNHFSSRNPYISLKGSKKHQKATHEIPKDSTRPREYSRSQHPAKECSPRGSKSLLGTLGPRVPRKPESSPGDPERPESSPREARRDLERPGCQNLAQEVSGAPRRLESSPCKCALPLGGRGRYANRPFPTEISKEKLNLRFSSEKHVIFGRRKPMFQ